MVQIYHWQKKKLYCDLLVTIYMTRELPKARIFGWNYFTSMLVYHAIVQRTMWQAYQYVRYWPLSEVHLHTRRHGSSIYSRFQVIGFHCTDGMFIIFLYFKISSDGWDQTRDVFNFRPSTLTTGSISHALGIFKWTLLTCVPVRLIFHQVIFPYSQVAAFLMDKGAWS
jgi:hypothetical protein